MAMTISDIQWKRNTKKNKYVLKVEYQARCVLCKKIFKSRLFGLRAINSERPVSEEEEAELAELGDPNFFPICQLKSSNIKPLFKTISCIE